MAVEFGGDWRKFGFSDKYVLIVDAIVTFEVVNSINLMSEKLDLEIAMFPKKFR